MTMKRQRTLHRFAAVAAVLLAFCLVFMMPVGAADVSTQDQLEDALAGSADVINIKSAIVLSSTVNIGRTVTINGGEHLISNADNLQKLFTITNNGVNPITVNFNGLNLTSNRDVDSAGNTARGIDLRSGNISLILQNSKILMTGKSAQPLTIGGSGSNINVEIIGSDIIAEKRDADGKVVATGYAITTFNPVTMTVSNSLVQGWDAFNIKGASSSLGSSGSKITVSGDSELIGTNPYSGNSDHFGVFKFEDDNIEVELTDTSVGWAEKQGTAKQYMFCFDTDDDVTTTLNGIKITLGNNVKLGVTGDGIFNAKGANTITFVPGIKLSKAVDTNVLGGELIAVENTGDDKTTYPFIVAEKKYEISSTPQTIGFTGDVRTEFTTGVEVDITNDGNQEITLVKLDKTPNHFAITGFNTVTLQPKETASFTVTPVMQMEAGTYEDTFKVLTDNENAFAEIKVKFIAELPKSSSSSIDAIVDEGKISISESSNTVASPGSDEIFGGDYVIITDVTNPSVSLIITGLDASDISAEGDGTITINLDDASEIIAPYLPMKTDIPDEDSSEEISVTLFIGLKTPDVSTLPTITGFFNANAASAVENVENKDYKPLSMINAIDNVEVINGNLVDDEEGAIAISFTISDALYQKYGGKFIVLHVKGSNVVEEISVSPVDNKDGTWSIPVYGDSFSSYVLAVDNTPKPEYTPTGGATDTGSGNYQYYPRSVPTDGIIDFGTSKVVTGMELPAGSDGTVTLNIKPTFAMPENGFYAFEIDAPGYNTDAKINGGLSFQIPVADLEAAGWTAEDIVLFHGTVGENGKITWEALPTNLVKNENGVASYKAAINSCSPFYIGFVKDGSVVNTEVVDPVTPETPETPETPVTPDEPEVLPPVDEPETPEQPTESPAPILAVLAGLGAAVVLRRK